MARNQEKANTFLNRFLRAQREEARGVDPKERRPWDPHSEADLGKAERWRRQIIGEITRMVSSIQNVALPEHEIRELNDRINKNLKLKRAWEHRVKHLGGPDYIAIAQPLGGAAIGGADGYLYFGAAKSLPGVRDSLHSQKEVVEKRKRRPRYRDVDADYFGLRDDDDGLLREKEAQAEAKARSKRRKVAECRPEHSGDGTSAVVSPGDMDA